MRKEREREKDGRGGKTLRYAKLSTIRQSTMPLISIKDVNYNKRSLWMYFGKMYLENENRQKIRRSKKFAPGF